MTDHSRPKWLKVAAIVAAVLLLLALAGVMIASGGEHGPGRHLPGSAPVDHGG